MAVKKKAKRAGKAKAATGGSTTKLTFKSGDEAARAQAPYVHVYGDHIICGTDDRGHATPRGMSLAELVVDASSGFIPLWDAGVTLRWRFEAASLALLDKPSVMSAKTKALLGDAMLAWGDAAPVKLAQRETNTDFEIAFMETDRCTTAGCVVASAFFPDGGTHYLKVYPKLFTLSEAEQVETLVHELGHVFGLRHFFAQISEAGYPSQVFGEHAEFSIMNYGANSILTEADRSDLKRLYEGAWTGRLTHINGTPIRLMRPYSAGVGLAA